MVLSTFTSFCLRNQDERLIARVVISDARNRGLRRGPGLERNATAWAYLRARSAGRLVGRLVGFFGLVSCLLVSYMPLAILLL